METGRRTTESPALLFEWGVTEGIREEAGHSHLGRVGTLCGRPRWAASVLLEAQSHFRRIQAYSQLPQLVNAMATRLDKKEAAAQGRRPLPGRKPNSNGKRDILYWYG